jgi:hypothetical protein
MNTLDMPDRAWVRLGLAPRNYGEARLSEPDVGERLDFALEHPTTVDLVTVAHLRHQVQQLDEWYDRVPSTSLLAEAGQCLGRVGFLCAYATNGRVRRELYAVEAEVATLMGQLVWDASQRRDHVTARMYLDQAVRAARQFPDPAAEGLALLRKSFVALYGNATPALGSTSPCRRSRPRRVPAEC